MPGMRRRDFVALFGGAAAAWPLAARAQQPSKARRIGVLTGGFGRTRKHASRHSWRRWHNWAGPTAKTCGSKFAGAVAMPTPTQVRDRIGRARPDVIMAVGGTATGALLQATRTVPIVFAIVPDPFGSGFVASLSRPGGNATGFLQFEYGLSGKWLELLKEIRPGLTRVAVLRGLHCTRRHRPVGRYAIPGYYA